MLRVAQMVCRLQPVHSGEDRLSELLRFLLYGGELRQEERLARVVVELGLTTWACWLALVCLSVFVCKMYDNRPNLLGKVDGIGRWGASKGSTVSGTQSVRRKCHTQLGAGPQVSVSRSTNAEELGAGRLQQTVTFEADLGEFPPSAGRLPPVGAEQPVSPWVVTVLLLGLVKGKDLRAAPVWL